MTRLARLAIASLAAILLVAIAAPRRSRAQSSPAANSATAAQGAAPAALPLIDAAGYEHALAKYKGKPLLVTFWATWCEPCRDEFPMLVDLEKKYGPKGLAVFGVSLDDNADLNVMRHFLQQNQPGFPSYRQKPGIDVDEFYHAVNPDWQGTMPETIFYGRDGKIVTHFVGGQTKATFERAIQTILAKNPRANAAPPAGH